MPDTLNLSVKGMSCQHCVARVDKALSGVNGVSKVEVSLDQGRATVEGSGLEPEALVKAVVEAGYGAAPE